MVDSLHLESETEADSDEPMLGLESCRLRRTLPIYRIIAASVPCIALGTATFCLRGIESPVAIGSVGANARPAEAIAAFQHADEAHSAADILLVDAGSTGSKVFAFFDGRNASAKLYTACDEPHKDAGHTNKGVAALEYRKEDCDWLVGALGPAKPLESRSEYVKELLTLLVDTYKTGSGKTDLQYVQNKAAVPILATGGMRLLSQEANQDVWGLLCGKTHAGLTIAPAGDLCGTIPGTKEAYYEYLANAALGKNRVLGGTFTIGGSSAQIALPLVSEQEVTAFRNLKEAIVKEVDCTELRIPSGEQAPIFNTNRKGGPKKECIDDFIVYMPEEEINASTRVKADIRTSGMHGIGLISFLGLQGKGSFVAGGVDGIYNWANQFGCNNNAQNYSSCRGLLSKALDEDIMFKHVKRYFTKQSVSITSFSYSTYAAIPEASGIADVAGDDEAWDLLKGLDEKCKNHEGARFGYEHSNTCMKALWTALYVTSFFAVEADNMKHNASDIMYSPNDWAVGLHELSKAGGPPSRRLPEMQPRHKNYAYADGARLHFYGDMAGRESPM
eukprot:TRINITY_DN12793_c0_g1_i1.p1 TRINITY_DN12793_c0_g1~~TRINITY_DN12793_c0_g1_i1.p1  ORF type:complete len:560 (+),score=86.38 TRINITY_DN12793_c0_g1_i1:147-1826(+)